MSDVRQTHRDDKRSFSSVLRRVQRGEPVVIGSADRSMVVVSAGSASVSTIEQMEAMTSAPIAVALSAQQFDRLGLVLHSETSPLPIGRPVDALPDPIAAMSRAGRAATIAALAADPANAVLRVPGHVTPLRANAGNLLSRVGLVEGAVDLVQLAGLPPAAMVAFLVDDEGRSRADEVTDMDPLPLSLIRSERLLSEQGRSHDEVQSLFVDAMTRLPSAVAVVTAKTGEGNPAGLLVSSMTSYSGNPPSIVFSVSTGSRTLEALLESADFGVNILAADQANVAWAFAGRGDKFESTGWDWDTGVPRVDGAQSFLRCRKVSQITLGDHTLFVGSIVTGTSEDFSPLIYFNKTFNWRLVEQG